MKKKMSLLIVLVMAVVATTYSVSGTYAKYTSKVDLTDEARIAKWEFKADGSTVDKNIDLFATSYLYNGTTYVKSSDTSKVVAPGTKGEYTFKLEGNMEVRYTLKFAIDATKDFVVYYDVVDGKVANMSTTNDGQANEYRPLRYSITYVDNAGVTHTDIANVTTVDLKTALDAYNAKLLANKGFGPGAMKQQYTIAWAWDKQTTVDGIDGDQVDKLDTFAGENLSTNTIEMGVSVTATQLAENHSEVSKN